MDTMGKKNETIITIKKKEKETVLTIDFKMKKRIR